MVQIRNGYPSNVAKHLKSFFSKLNKPATGLDAENEVVNDTDNPSPHGTYTQQRNTEINQKSP